MRHWNRGVSGLLISELENATDFTWSSDKTGAIDLKMDESALEEIWSFKMVEWALLSLLNSIGALALSLLLKLKIGTLMCSMKFVSLEVALHLCKSMIQPCMKYCWAGAPSCYLELLDKVQKWICRAVDPSLAASWTPGS